jgi:hypothetical protein
MVIGSAKFGLFAAAGVSTEDLTGAAFIAGGNGYTNDIAKMPFSTDTIADLSATLDTGASGNAACSDSGVAGYVAGGYHGGSPATSENIDKLTYANDTAALMTPTLSLRRHAPAGMQNSGVAGYFAGGDNEGTASYQTINDKLVFATATCSTTTAMATGGDTTASFSNSGTAGYLLGGYHGGGAAGYKDEVEKFAFPSDTRSALTAMAYGSAWSEGFADVGVSGYHCGGWEVVAQNVTTIYKWAFSNDARTTSSGSLSVADSQQTGGANSGSAGFVFAGYSGGATWVNKFTFPTDTRSSLTAMGGSQYGAGGFANEGTLA